MSYYVIKGPRSGGQYLSIFPEHKCPQWYGKRATALRFPDEGSAWNFLAMTAEKHGGAGEWSGRVVRVDTAHDRKAMCAMQLSQIEGYRVAVKLKDLTIQDLKAELAKLRSPQATDTKEKP